MLKFSGTGEMKRIKNNSGMFISLVLHALALAVPVSMITVQRFHDVEIFVMGYERPVFHEKKIVQKEKVQRLAETRPEVKEIERIQPIESPPEVEEEKDIEETKPVITQEAHPPDMEVREAAPSHQVFLTEDTTDTPPALDVEFGVVNGPAFLYRELPVYPMLARRMGKEGTVVLRLTIGEKGDLLDVEIIEGAGFGFREAAVEAVKRSSFLPAKKGGKPVTSRAILPIRFTLRRG